MFNIQVGTAITVAIADGSKAAGDAARVFYNDSWADGLFSRKSKFDRLALRSDAGWLENSVEVRRGLLDDMRPAPFEGGEWVDLRECFTFSRSGVQTKRDHFVYATARSALLQRLGQFRGMTGDAADKLFAGTTAKPWHVANPLPVLEDRIQSHILSPPRSAMAVQSREFS
ncbi:MAG: hypothetical protein WDM81_13410 [Rhizomicrobium sp.]